MDNSKTSFRPTWFHVITRPKSHLLVTIAVFAVFIAGIALGAYFSEYSFWFYLPALGLLMWWYLAMMTRYRKGRTS